MRVSTPFIERPVATSMLMFALLLVGVVGFLRLPVSPLPEVEYPIIQVRTFYPGGSPEVIESTITAPLEKQLGMISGLTQISSSSGYGVSSITLLFNLDLNIDVAEQQVQAAINSAYTYLPQDLPTPPIYSKSNPADAPVMTLALTSSFMPLIQVHDLADTRLAQKIAQLPGVGLVNLNGGLKPAIHIKTNPTVLAAYGISLEEFRSSLAQSTLNQAKGNFDGPEIAMTILANDQMMTVEEFKKQVIAYRNTGPVRVEDVASVVEEPENRNQASLLNNTPAVILAIHRQPGANTISVVDSIKEILPELEAGLPGDIQIEEVSDRTTTTRASIRHVEHELLLTIALVVMVIFLFLRNIPATLIPSLSVPLSLAGTFAAMYALGYSLNNLTLMAVTIATGFVVDDAIVMLENIIRHAERGESPRRAAIKGAEEIGFTILSLTASLIAVLIPLLFMGDVLGRLFREFAMTLTLAILVSALVSLTLTPMLAAFLPRSKFIGQHHEPWALMEKISTFYDRTLAMALDHQNKVIGIGAGLLAMTLWLMFLVPKGFFPVQDIGMVYATTEADPSIGYESMKIRQQELAQVLLKDPDVDNLTSHIGIDGTNMQLGQGRFLITLKPYEERDGAAKIIQRLNTAAQAVPGIRLYLQPIQDLTIEDRVSRAQYQFTVESPDASLLEDWSRKIVGALNASTEIVALQSNDQDKARSLKLEIDRDTASRLGVSAQIIAQTLYDAYGQRQIITRYSQLNQYRVILEVDGHFQSQPQDLNSLYLPIPGNRTIPLTGLLREVESLDPPVIHRQSQFPAATYSFNLGKDTALGDAVARIKERLEDLDLPKSLRFEFQGTAQAFEGALANQLPLLIAAILSVYIVLGMLYESYVHPLTILSTLPSAAVGALLMLGILGLDLDIVSLIGIVLLIGIVAKNAIMMIDFAMTAQRLEGLSPREAIHKASLLRLRPILMTTMAALLAGVPLALGTGMGEEMRRPLGVVIIGGLIFSQIMTLYTTPCIYLGFDLLAKRFRSRLGIDAGPSAE
jgi:multidrug efflux pump